MKLKKWPKIALVIIILGGIGTLLVWEFFQGRKELAMEQEREGPIKVPSRVSAQGGEIVVTLDPDVQEKSGIVASAPASASHHEELKA